MKLGIQKVFLLKGIMSSVSNYIKHCFLSCPTKYI